MFELCETADLKKMLATLTKAFGSPRAELDVNGERVKYKSSYEIKMGANEIIKELRLRDELPRRAPARLLYTYRTGNP